MELESSFHSKLPPIQIKFGAIIKGKGFVEISNDKNRTISDLKVQNVRYMRGEDRNKKMKIEGKVVRFNVMHPNGEVYRVGVKIKDFVANETQLKAYLKQNPQLPAAIPKQIQKQIDKTKFKDKTVVRELKTMALEVKKDPPKLEDFPGLTKQEFEAIKTFYRDKKPHIDELGEENKSVFYNRNRGYHGTSVILPRSLVFVPGKGTFVLLKQHGGVNQFGIGTYNRVTLAVNIETGEQMAWRSARKEGVQPNEIEANEAACEFSEFFDAADNFVYYFSNVRDGDARKTKTGTQLMDVSKIGSLVPIAKSGDLENFLENNKLPPATRLSIFSEFQESLHVLHTDLKKTHRDLKPANITMTEDWHPRIADFGFTVNNNSMSYRDGSPLWIPPEIFRNQSRGTQSVITPSIDIWSSGIILLEIMGGKEAHNSWHDNFRDRLWSDLQKGIVDSGQLKQVKDTVFEVVKEKLRKEGCGEKEINDIIAIADQCLSVDPKNRPNAKMVRQDIAKVVSRLPNREVI